MLGHSDIHRSIANMTINLARAMEERKSRADHYKLGEVEWQTQHEFYGDVDSTPVESTITIPFGITFLADAGNARDSSLDRPFVRLSAERIVGLPGFIAYHSLVDWVLDDDRNFTGAVVMMGVHCPVLVAGGAVDSTAFQYILHASFQGYGAIWDPDGPFDSGGTIDDSGLS